MKQIIVDNRISEKCELSLIKEGFSLLKLPSDPLLGSAVASHPDTVMFYSDGELITTADYCDVAAYIFSDIREYNSDIKISFTGDRRGSSYPNDCVLNALKIKGRIFCKSDTISDRIKELADAHGYEIIHTNQGYPSCVTLHFGNSAITSDAGLGSLLQKYGVRVTLIGTEGISLPPYEYGFIGGASGVIGDKIYFFGDISTHPDASKILDAIRAEGFTPVSLSDESLVDLGGIISL